MNDLDESLVQRLVRDLHKSGFYSEMRAIRACSAAKWECHGSFTYFDRDERATRECDFEAVKRWGEVRQDRSKIRIVAQLLGQVKKSESPWIVFVDRSIDPIRISDASDNILVSTIDSESIANVLRRHSLIGRNGWAGTGVHEAFKRPNDASKWYSAFVSVCKAAESALEAVEPSRDPGTYVHLIKPIVVLDGVIFAAELAEDGELVLNETETAGFVFEYRSDAYVRRRYHLDLVTLAALPRYLVAMEERMTAIAEALLR